MEILRFLITVMLSLKEVILATNLLDPQTVATMVEEVYKVLSRETMGRYYLGTQTLIPITTFECKPDLTHSATWIIIQAAKRL